MDTFYVRPIFKGYYLGTSPKPVTANLDSFTTNGVSCVTGYDIENHGISFWDVVDNDTALASTRRSTKDGVSCRQAYKNSKGNTTFNFGCDDATLRANGQEKFLVGISYYDTSERTDSTGITLNYIKRTDGTVGSVSIVPERTRDNQWKTATVVLDDVKFTGVKDWGGFDLRIEGGWSTYLSRFWVVPVDADGNLLPAVGENSSSTSYGAKVGVKATTEGTTASITLAEAKHGLIENGLKYYWQTTSGNEGYTTSYNGGRNTSSDSTSKHYFYVDHNIFPSSASGVNIKIKINYYKYNYEGGTIKMYYKKTDGSVGTASIVALSNKSSNKEWADSSEIAVNNVIFDGSFYNGADFYIMGDGATSSKNEAALKSVTITKTSTPTESNISYAKWNKTSNQGLSLVSGGTVSGDYYTVSTGQQLKFNVDNTYMFGPKDYFAKINVTYLDSGSGKIYVYYNSKDKQSNSSITANKKSYESIQCTNTGKVKTATIMLVDANFVDNGGYDFYIQPDDATVTIQQVAVGKGW